MLLNWVQTGIAWYYFNVIAIAVIIYKMIDLATIRAKNAALNTAESQTKEDKLFVKAVIFLGVFGVAYFFTREYISDMREIWISVVEFTQRVINGK